MTDDQRHDTLWAMRTVQEELVAKGVTFTNAMVPHPLCCPSRASFLTGQYSHNHGVWTNRQPFGGARGFEAEERDTLATWLQGSGYRTLLAGKYLNGYNLPRYQGVVPPGWSDWFAMLSKPRSFYTGTKYSDNGETWTQGENAYSTTVVGNRVARFIRETPADQPFFAMVTPSAAHSPFEPKEKDADEDFEDFDKPEGFELPYRPPNFNGPGMVRGDRPRWLRTKRPIREQDLATFDERSLNQLRMLQSVDDAVADVITALEETGRMENTMIVYTSDQGFFWGEHRLRAKSAPYDAGARIPMVIRYDPLTGGAASEQGGLVLNLDIAPTFTDLAGARARRRMDGKSLVPLLDGSRSRVRTRFIMESPNQRRIPGYCGARDEGHLYVRWHRGFEELISYRDDPWELENRASDPTQRRALLRLRRFTRKECRPRPPGFDWGSG